MKTRTPSRILLRRRLRALALAAAALAPLLAAAVDDPTFRAAREPFQRAAAGETALIDASAERFAALSKAEPQDPVLRAYAGAATTMRALATVWPWKKLAYVDEGTAQLDKALAQLGSVPETLRHDGVPAPLQVRFVAANTFLGLPAMFNRGDRGAKLLDEVLASPQLAAAPAAFQASVWLRAGQRAAAAGQPAEARRWYERAAAGDTPAAQQAQAALGGLK